MTETVEGDESALDEAAGASLVSHARASVRAHLDGETVPRAPTGHPVLRARRGAFVTLRIEGRLRGCCGRPDPTAPLAETVGRVAVEAAVRDPRFPSLGADELGATRVTVNVLGQMENLTTVAPGRLPAAVTVGRHGLRVTCDGRVGLLLPEVAADRDADAETFLGMTCKKAGLPGDAWTRPDARVERFTAERFAERAPAGRVVRESAPATGAPTE